MDDEPSGLFISEELRLQLLLINEVPLEPIFDEEQEGVDVDPCEADVDD